MRPVGSVCFRNQTVLIQEMIEIYWIYKKSHPLLMVNWDADESDGHSGTTGSAHLPQNWILS